MTACRTPLSGTTSSPTSSPRITTTRSAIRSTADWHAGSGFADHVQRQPAASSSISTASSEAGVSGFPRGSRPERLQNLAAAHRLRLQHLRERQDRAPRRLRHVLRARPGQRCLQRRSEPAIRLSAFGDQRLLLESHHQRFDRSNHDSVFPVGPDQHQVQLSASGHGTLQPRYPARNGSVGRCGGSVCRLGRLGPERRPRRSTRCPSAI